MATIGATNLTLLDRVRRTAPDGGIAQIVEQLSKECPIIGDAVAKEGNLPDAHKFTVRQTLPTISTRRFDEGVAPTKSTTSQVTEPMAMFNAQSVVDEDLADLNGDQAAFRASEDVSFLSAMTQQIESSLAYDNATTNPKTFTGFMPRLASTSTGALAKQIVKNGAGGSNTNTSMLLVGWGDRGCHVITPKGGTAGLTMRNLGRQLVADSGGTNKFVGLVSDWTWKLGLAIEDVRTIAAVRNIDMSTETGGTIGTPVNDLIISAIQAFHLIQNPKSVKLIWYVSRKLSSLLHQQAVNAISKSTLTYENIAGSPVVSLLGIPVHISDGLTNVEAAIS